MTGASPTGANPAGVVQTSTSASGTRRTTQADALPTSKFSDNRGALDLEWNAVWGRFSPTVSGHFSREKDYRSLGFDGALSTDLNQKLTTVTVGGGQNRGRRVPAPRHRRGALGQRYPDRGIERTNASTRRSSASRRC
jgi:hypothetical protein